MGIEVGGSIVLLVLGKVCGFVRYQPRADAISCCFSSQSSSDRET
jgi:hypothetical protein